MKESVAIVTGGVQGIGQAITEALLENKAKVLVVDLHVPLDTRNHFEKKYGPENVGFTKCDITNIIEFDNAFKFAISKFGKIDILINNAGFLSEKVDDWNKMIEVNVRGTVNGTKLALNYMGKHKGHRGGTVINVGSIGVVNDWSELPVYTASKAFVEQYSRNLGSSKHYPSTGVRVICIHPGATITPMLQNTPFDDETPYLLDHIQEFVLRNLENIQSTQAVAISVMHVLDYGDSGSSWLLENGNVRRVNYQSPEVSPSEKFAEFHKLRANL